MSDSPSSPPKKRSWKMIAFILLALCCVFGIIGEFARQTVFSPTPTASSPVEVAVAPTATPPPPLTNTSAPLPTPTPIPTIPTATPLPTNTPAPTSTPTPPPDPITFNGQGDTILNLQKWPGLALLWATGNDASRYFAITLYDAAGDMLDIPVNTTDPYTGLTPLDFDGSLTTRLEVNAEGPWAIDVVPVSVARSLQVPGEITGAGNEVIALLGVPDLATVRGNQASRYFGVSSYHLTGALLGIPVNTTDPYEGTVIISHETAFLEITAAGEWVISLTAAP